MSEPTRPGLSLAACLLWLLAAPVMAAAETGDTAPAPGPDAGGQLAMQIALGFSGVFRPGRWTPLTVTLANRGRDLLGRLEVETGGGDEFRGDLYTTVQRRRIELPGNSQKRFRHTVFLERPSTPLTVRVVAGGRELARRSIDLRPRSAAGRIVLVLSRDADLDYLNDSGHPGLRVLYPHPELLPERWQGYDGVNALVIHGVSLERLSAAQFEALKRWLAAGGVCVISGGPDYALLRTPRLAELLPAVPTGTAQVAAGSDDASPRRLWSQAPRPFTVNRLTRVRGRILHRAGGLPLVVERDLGRGRVLYLSFDIARAPFAHWDGMQTLWPTLLRSPPPRSLEPAPTDNPVPAVIRGQASGFPRHGAVFVFLLLYLGILASGYRLAVSGIDRRLLPWLIWSAPLLFAPAAYFLFGPVFYPQGATVIALSTLEPIAESRYARLRLDLGMYSRRRPERLRFAYAGAEPVLLPLPRVAPVKRSSSAPVPLRVEGWLLHEGDRPALQPLDQRTYVLHLLQGYDVVADDLSGSVTRTPDGLRLQLRNDPGRPLYNAWLLVGQRGYSLGSLAAGAELSRDLDAGRDALRVQDITWRALPAGPGTPDPSAAKVLFQRALDEAGENAEHGFDTALLLGVGAGPLRLPGAGDRARRRALTATLVRARLPLTPPPAGGGVHHVPD